MKKTSKKPAPFSATQFFKQHRLTAAVLLGAAVILLLLRLWAAPAPVEDMGATEYAEYETGRVLQVLTDSTQADPTSDGAYRGDQMLVVEVTSGRYKGETLQVYNYVGPLYGVPVKEGDSVALTISTYQNGDHTATVYEYNRAMPLAVVVALFLAAAIAVGGKTGLKSLIGLGVTLLCLFWVLLPALMKGAPTLLTVFLICALIAVVTLTILGGVEKKTVCAMAGTIAGTALALLFGVAAQALVRIDGLRVENVEALLQLRQTGTPIGLRGLLVGGVVISALGAVMDVTMGIASSLTEVCAADSQMSRRDLFRSGMNIGRDMVGTMTNTLILAFLGSSFVLILYLYSMNLSLHQLLSSAFLSIEVVSGISSSIGVILSIPITAAITAYALTREK